MKIANLISKLQKPIYQFGDINSKFATIIFTNVALENSFYQQFPAVKQIFYLDVKQKEQVVKTIQNQKEIIQFNDSIYLGQFVNKIFKNKKNRATRFEYAQVEFLDKDYWQYMYEIVNTMDGQSSKLVIRIKEDVLKECLECNLETIEQYNRLFIQKIVNIGMINLFQISLQSLKQLDGGIQEYVLRCCDSKEDLFTWDKKQLLYKSKGKLYYQMGMRSMANKPEAVVGEVYPQLE